MLNLKICNYFLLVILGLTLGQYYIRLVLMPLLRNPLVLSATLSLFLTTAAFTYASDSDLISPVPTKAKTGQRLLDEKKAALEDKKNQIKNLAEQKKASAEAKKQEVKDKLAAVRDEKKKALIARIQEKLANINKNRTDHLLKILTRLEEIVKKIESRSTELKAKGVNTAVVDTAVTTAKTALTNAKAAVTAQASKVYEITVSTETTAKNGVGLSMKGLETDLKTVRDLVKSAQGSVMKAVVALKALKVPVAVTVTSVPAE